MCGLYRPARSADVSTENFASTGAAATAASVSGQFVTTPSDTWRLKARRTSAPRATPPALFNARSSLSRAKPGVPSIQRPLSRSSHRSDSVPLRMCALESGRANGDLGPPVPRSAPAMTRRWSSYSSRKDHGLMSPSHFHFLRACGRVRPSRAASFDLGSEEFAPGSLSSWKVDLEMRVVKMPALRSRPVRPGTGWLRCRPLG